MATAWKRVASAASAFVFLAATVACAEHGWHAPRTEILVPLFAVGIIFGVGVSLLRSRGHAAALSEDRPDAILEVTSASHTTHALAALVGACTSLASGVALGLTMADWQQLVLASLVGALYMATWPLQVLAAHILLERKLSVGIDGVRVGRRNVPFHAIRAATADAKDGSIVLACADGSVIRHRCANVAIARDLAERITSRLASDVTTARVAPRDGRALEAWRSELLASDYRAAEITRDAAAQILRSATSTADERIGAALILAGRAEGDEKTEAHARIRVAAASCVDRRLRVALERVAEDTLDEATLDSVSPKRARA